MKLNTKSGILGLACALGISANVAYAAPKPQPMKVGETKKFKLAADGSTDFTVPLGKGSYRIVWDAKRSDGEVSNIIGKVRLLKPNGVIMDNYLLTFNELADAYRVGTVLKVPKPFVARFRIENSDAFENWFTVVPLSNAKRVPFGWGSGITPARISSDNGVGGILKPKQSFYHSITLPKGKWSISLGMERSDGEKSNVIGRADLLDTLGFAITQRFITVNEIDKQARAEGVLNVVKPTPYLLRITNGTTDSEYKYDVTIEPAS